MRAAWYVTMALALWGCSDGSSPSTAGDNAAQLQQAIEVESGPKVLFLPPLGIDDGAPGSFQAALAPIVHVDRVDAQGQVLDTIATFGGSSDSEPVTYQATDQLYLTHWHTNRYDLNPADGYRIAILVEGSEVGSLDIDLLAKGEKPAKHAKLPSVRVGETLPIKFRLSGAVDAGKCDAVHCTAPSDSCHTQGSCDPWTGECNNPTVPSATLWQDYCRDHSDAEGCGAPRAPANSVAAALSGFLDRGLPLGVCIPAADAGLPNLDYTVCGGTCGGGLGCSVESKWLDSSWSISHTHARLDAEIAVGFDAPLGSPGDTPVCSMRLDQTYACHAELSVTESDAGSTLSLLSATCELSDDAYVGCGDFAELARFISEQIVTSFGPVIDNTFRSGFDTIGCADIPVLTRCSGVICQAQATCHAAGSCDEATGLCSNPNAPDGTACDDADVCSERDQCVAGACVGEPVPTTPVWANYCAAPSTEPGTCVEPVTSSELAEGLAAIITAGAERQTCLPRDNRVDVGLATLTLCDSPCGDTLGCAMTPELSDVTWTFSKSHATLRSKLDLDVDVPVEMDVGLAGVHTSCDLQMHASATCSVEFSSVFTEGRPRLYFESTSCSAYNVSGSGCASIGDVVGSLTALLGDSTFRPFLSNALVQAAQPLMCAVLPTVDPATVSFPL